MTPNCTCTIQYARLIILSVHASCLSLSHRFIILPFFSSPPSSLSLATPPPYLISTPHGACPPCPSLRAESAATAHKHLHSQSLSRHTLHSSPNRPANQADSDCTVLYNLNETSAQTWISLESLSCLAASVEVRSARLIGHRSRASSV